MTEQPSAKAPAGSPPQNYERFFVQAIAAPLAADLLALAAPHPGARVLDVACGTGVVTRLAAERVGEGGTVVGLDVNPGMLAVARSTADPRLPIDWREASAEAMPLGDASFDLVFCQMGLQFMPDRLAALREMRRVLAPGGRLFLNLPGPTPQLFQTMGEALGRHLGPEAAAFVDQVFSLHDAQEIQDLVDGAGFEDVSIHFDARQLRLPPPAEFLWQYVYSTPLAAAAAQADEQTRGLLESEVASKWRELMDNRGLVLRVRVVVAIGRRA